MTIITSRPTGLTPERINELSRNFWNSAVLRAGIKLGVFPLLEERSHTPDNLAAKIGANPRFVQAFLEACVELELAQNDGDSFCNSPLSSSFLLPGKHEYVGDLVLHITNYWHTWGNLDRLIVEGVTELPFENGFTDAATYWTDYMKGQHNRAAAGQGQHLVNTVDLTGRRKMLDLGGGAASYSIALCGANPKLNSRVIDQREPLEIAEPLVDDAGLEDRITLVEGDFFEMDLGADSDVVLISGVVLIVSEQDCRRAFRRAYDALAPGGMIIVQDFMRIDPRAERTFLDVMMDMYVLVGFDPGAGDRDGDEYASWLADAGFTSIDQTPLPTQLAVITGRKPVDA
ncbi:MAG: methyltransferase [SAR202 cluster bacterium]|nr:methyltransferase [SAR202 cluster bacterium]MDP6301418.1 methyltransferase [SAR202 cluster bacterium]MDP7104928.1 methyltransferase [SAR202 cluster bacterium]MDP7226770.1 methyltransferase [SAR202 cluster bacterium]MDP7413020.1 methyltransferase [SAR202 cluster bacterium]